MRHHILCTQARTKLKTDETSVRQNSYIILISVVWFRSYDSENLNVESGMLCSCENVIGMNFYTVFFAPGLIIRDVKGKLRQELRAWCVVDIS